MSMQRQCTKLVYEGEYVAEITVTLIEDESGWSPYLSVEEAARLDAVRAALRKGDLAGASKEGHVYKLTPVAV